MQSGFLEKFSNLFPSGFTSYKVSILSRKLRKFPLAKNKYLKFPIEIAEIFM